MKQIPNLFTLLNLIFGCLAIVMILQSSQGIITLDSVGNSVVDLPEKIWAGSLFIFAAAVVDFLDGFLARLLKAQSPMGEQLDSLSDVVSFGVAPGMILYQLLRVSYAQEENGLNASIVFLLPAFIFTGAVAWRLAKFNLSTDQTTSFRGVPSPAAGLLIASLPLIIQFTAANNNFEFLAALLINKWLLYGVIALVSYLMLSRFSFLALKFKSLSPAKNLHQYILIGISVLAIIFLGWLSVPVIFVVYVLISLIARPQPEAVAHEMVLDEVSK